MTRKQAKTLRVGSRVEFICNNSVACLGTVFEKSWCAVKIVWDDDQVAEIDLDELGDVYLASQQIAA